VRPHNPAGFAIILQKSPGFAVETTTHFWPHLFHAVGEESIPPLRRMVRHRTEPWAQHGLEIGQSQHLLRPPKKRDADIVPSGKHTKNYGKSTFLMGKPSISIWAMASIANC